MDQTMMPLYEIVSAHINKHPISFHVPGHKNGALYDGFHPSFFPFAHFDVTELSNLDDLHHPTGAIADAQHLLSELFQTRKSYFLVNGTTVGNLAMILATCHEGDSVIVQRNCHKSILNALMLAKVNPIFISPEWNTQLCIPTGVSIDSIQKALNQYKDVKACILTYPDYYGQAIQLKEIIALLHEQNVMVLIDEAHGAHFQIGTPFPCSSLSLGADIVVQSAHKTLPAMTMGSYLHINTHRVSEKKVERYLSILQSSSPSYPIMISLDFARHYLANFAKEDINYTLKKKEEFIQAITEIDGISILESDDPIKILLRHDQLSGYELQGMLESANIYSELADPYQVLIILPLLKMNKTFPFQQAIEKIKNISWEVKKSSKPPAFKMDADQQEITKLIYSYNKMEYMTYQWIQMDKAIGKVAAKMIVPYPPGIPLLLPGEKITERHMELLITLIETGARFQGESNKINEGYIAVFCSLTEF